MHSDRAPLPLRLAAIGGLVFLLAPIALIFVYAFTTEEKSFQWPPPGFTLKMSVGRVPRCAWAAAWSEPSGDTATRRPPTRAAIARLRQAVNCGYQDD